MKENGTKNCFFTRKRTTWRRVRCCTGNEVIQAGVQKRLDTTAARNESNYMHIKAAGKQQ